jgi:hypothetical protein
LKVAFDTMKMKAGFKGRVKGYRYIQKGEVK